MFRCILFSVFYIDIGEIWVIYIVCFLNLEEEVMRVKILSWIRLVLFVWNIFGRYIVLNLRGIGVV